MRASLSVAMSCLLLAPAFASGEAPAPPATSSAASTDVYKCSGPNGAVVYQEGPCAPGRELRNFATDPGAVSVIPFKDAGKTSPAPPARTEPSVRAPSQSPSRSQAPRASGGGAAERRHLREGMTEAEVIARVGAPDLTSGKSGNVRWSYLPAPADPATITTVRLEHGKVVAVERKVVR